MKRTLIQNAAAAAVIMAIVLFAPAVGLAAQEGEYDFSGAGEEYRFIWPDPDDAYLKELDSKYDLNGMVSSCDTDLEKVQVLSAWVSGLWEHSGANQPAQSDPISIIETARRGGSFRCVEYAIVLNGCLNAVGIPARTLHLATSDVETRVIGAGHMVVEAYLTDMEKWVMVDGQWDAVPVCNGMPLNAVELRKALSEGGSDLTLYSLSGTKPEEYFAWVKEYLFYLSAPLDCRVGPSKEHLTRLMLVPKGAVRPRRFQLFFAFEPKPVYTHSVSAFYPNPMVDRLRASADPASGIISRPPAPAPEDGSRLIGEILVEGLTRSDVRIVTRQLPFQVGDPWTRELRPLAKERLKALDIFHPVTLRVEGEMMDDDRVRVIISAQDASPWMVLPVSVPYVPDWVQFGLPVGSLMLSGGTSHRFRNPTGNGMSLSVSHESNPAVHSRLQVDYPLSAGKVLAVELTRFSFDRKGVSTEYSEEGKKMKLQLSQVPAVGLQLSHSISLRDSRYQEQGSGQEDQRYLLLQTGLRAEKIGTAVVEFEYGIPLQEGLTPVMRGRGFWQNRWDLGKDRILISVFAGLAAPDVPGNFQFSGPQFNQVLLRGQAETLSGTAYAASRFEYHRSLLGDLLYAVGFVDCGQVVPAGLQFARSEWEIDGGFGLSAATPFGSLRLDVGFDTLKSKPRYLFGLRQRF